MADAATDWTDAPPSHFLHQPGTEPIPGYRLISPLGQGGFGEVWKCEAPGGLLKAIKFVHGAIGLEAGVDVPAEEELRAIERVKAIRHPFLLSMERVERCGRDLVIVLELADHNLASVLVDVQKTGQPGIPRDRLLGYLREAAEALDLMNLQHNLQHLDIKPHNLFLVGNHVKVGDFGRVNTLKGSAGEPPSRLQNGAITPVYAAPELFDNAISQSCDQYSLAIVFQELLTGTRPFHGKNARQFMMQHLAGEPNLEPLPAADRIAVARALSKKPADRFPSCGDFVHALAAGQTEVVTVQAPSLTASAALVSEAGDAPAVKPLDLSNDSLEGLRFLGCIRRTPLTEVHRAERTDGEGRFVTVLFGCAGKNEEASARLSALQHPALAPVKVIRDSRGGLALITAPPGRPLRDRFQDCIGGKLPGVPRGELLAALRAAAGALDFLYHRHTLAHLGLNPRNLLLDEGRLQMADFGLAHLLWLPAGHAVAKLNARYSAPELFRGQAGAACDQYSLALIYHEMLTGALPAFTETRDENGPVRGQPVLDLLPAADRAAVARALSPDPDRRWDSCSEFVHALETGDQEQGAEAVPAQTPATAQAGGPAEGVLQTWFSTLLTPEQIQARLDGFRQQWRGTTVSISPVQKTGPESISPVQKTGPESISPVQKTGSGFAEAGDFVYRMPTPRSFWQRWTGRRPGLEVRVRVSSSPSAAGAASRVEVEVRPQDCGREHGVELLGGVAPLLVESVRTFLQVNLHRRRQERLPWQHALVVCPIALDGTPGEPIECQGKDISLGGISFYLSGEPPTGKLSLRLPRTPQTQSTTALARVVRIQDCGEGWCEVGALLLRTEEAAGG